MPLLLQNTRSSHLHKRFWLKIFLLSAACREGMFGRNCQQSCGSDLNCKGLRFCLPDPYGCSCASGWFGTRCETRECGSYSVFTPLFFFLVLFTLCSPFSQPALVTCTGRTASWAANARMVESASVSVDARVPQGGEDRAVRNQVGFWHEILFSIHSNRIYPSRIQWQH